MKILKRNLDEAEEEIQKEKTQKRKAQRECEDMLENQEALTREVNTLKTKLRYEPSSSYICSITIELHFLVRSSELVSIMILSFLFTMSHHNLWLPIWLV